MADHRTVSDWKAPTADGGVLIAPPLNDVAALLEENRLRLGEPVNWTNNLSLAEFRAEARAEVLQAAYEYTRRYADVAAPASSIGPLFVSGHQPQLFHPGVWYKNFLLSRLAKQFGGAAINLVIDSDVARIAAVSVPTGTIESPRLESIPYDAPSAQVPYEERKIADRATFDSFASRATAAMSPLIARPLLTEFWPRAIACAASKNNLGLAISRARHQQELAWGSVSYELPQSRLCRTVAYRQFVGGLITQADALARHYNAAVEDYRHANHIRNAAHPVPNLIIDADGVELPLWLWSADAPQRRRVFVERHGLEWVLTDRQCTRLVLPSQGQHDSAALVEQLALWEVRGIKLRPRALANTLFARLAFADLFVHGIGGAKYDQVTDAIIGGVWGLSPPRYLTATATLRLPVPRPGVTADDVQRANQHLRELQYHPERWIDDADQAAQHLAAEKQRWIESHETPAIAKRRCQAIRGINQALQPHVSTLRAQLLAERDRLGELARTEKILGSREYAFCLYPAEQLRQLLLPK